MPTRPKPKALPGPARDKMMKGPPRNKGTNPEKRKGGTMLTRQLHGSFGLRLLQVLLFATFDILSGWLNINLGRYPRLMKHLIIRAMVYHFGYPMTPDQGLPEANRAQRRKVYFGLSHQAQEAMVPYRGMLRPVPAGGATIVGSRSGLFWKNVPGQLPTIVDAKHFSGNVFFVDANTAQGGTTSGYGQHPDHAFTDIEAAIDNPVYASQGDVVFVLPGHSETVSDEITVDVAGVSIIGLGEGSARPQLTQAFAGDCFALDAANCVLDNLYFNEATTAPAAGGAAIDMNAANCKVLNSHFDLGALDLEAITITATGDGAEISGSTFLVTANGPDAGIEIEAIVTEVHIHHNRFLGGNDSNAWDTGGINSTVAHTQCEVVSNRFTYGPAIIFSAAATGLIAHNLMGEGTLASMLDPGSCMCFENYEADAVDQSGRLIPTTVAS